MTYYYGVPGREVEPHALPDVEVFYAEDGDLGAQDPDDFFATLPAGWYWWSCFPGCLPDSEAVGPFDDEGTALADARDNFDDYYCDEKGA